ncbi:calcium/sodium antiporter [Sansalvadorimonas sp. 2012CJ34-2]|uniref:Calcium/sodium antiporter n=1 Tax=Parendozoicomonas callyspongiae TaxID=2942213 RepID=A0ABT0PC14_9GAMM|nr:calcium/sodium antiporter [Sansalvadorimonas sp. 2012CJ34-2]MCL6268889.1 calcium/sodium antiporter [Sansalvadorimonas sp. 2012CJ34-2]
MFLASGALFLGFLALMWSADHFVDGAAATARNLGMSPMLIGLTIVSIGTSSPEILVSLMAALSGHGDLAIGNIVGSNIANIALVLGATLLLAPIPVNSMLAKRELPLLTVITLATGVLIYDQFLSRPDGIILIVALVVTLFIIHKWQQQNRRPEDEVAASQECDEEIPELSQGKASLNLAVGLVVLLVSSRMLVWSATEIALWFGVSELTIGLTVVAIGTSLPELAASITSALKKHHDMAIGNVIGSNIFNLLAVMAVPGLVAPMSIDPTVFGRDFPIMAGLTILLAIMTLVGKTPKVLGRPSGFLLLGCYIAYTLLILFQA